MATNHNYIFVKQYDGVDIIVNKATSKDELEHKYIEYAMNNEEVTIFIEHSMKLPKISL